MPTCAECCLPFPWLPYPGIQLKCPVFLARYVHFLQFSLEALSTRKPLTTIFLVCRTVDGRGGHSAQHDSGLRKLKGGPKQFQDVDPQ